MLNEMKAVLTTAKLTKDAAKIVMDVAKKFDQVELKMKIIDLVNQVYGLNTEILELRDKLATKDEYVFRSRVYWQKEHPEADAPYCPKCFEDQGKPIHLVHHATDEGYEYALYQCPVCRFGIRASEVEAR